VKEIVDQVERWRDRGEKVAVATVVATRMSAPRPVGAKFAVSESGEICGSVSGGCVESDIAEHAKAVLETGVPRLLSYGISDAPGGIYLYTPRRRTGVLVTGKPAKTKLPPPFDQVPGIGVGHQIHHKFAALTGKIRLSTVDRLI